LPFDLKDRMLSARPRVNEEAKENEVVRVWAAVGEGVVCVPLKFASRGVKALAARPVGRGKRPGTILLNTFHGPPDVFIGTGVAGSAAKSR
jgi:hypothetical protein